MSLVVVFLLLLGLVIWAGNSFGDWAGELGMGALVVLVIWVFCSEWGKDGWRARYFVLCNYDEGGCGAAGGERHSVDEAADCWNERRRKYRG